MDVAHWLFLLLTWLIAIALGDLNDANLHVTRHNSGDLFHAEGVDKKECKPETCVGLSSGTAGTLPGGELCRCQCHSHLPAFREDLRICVDDIHECVLAPFVGGSTSQQIPFVFLPLKGQIVHPSKEINFAGIQTPVCAVSGAKYLTETGWVDLRNPVDKDVPLRLFRDEGRTFLQWNGEPELRTQMSGRLILVYLMCREVATDTVFVTGPTLFSPCVAFRVVGSPVKLFNNVSEVAFAPDAHSGADSSDRMSVSEYVAIGIGSVLLGLIYVASVFLYLHLRKRNSGRIESNIENCTSLTSVENGIVKNNPLLAMAAQFQNSDAVYSDSTNSENDMSDVIKHDEDRSQTHQITSALVHNQYPLNSLLRSFSYPEGGHQESATIEKLPEENVSIIETLEGRDERFDSFKALSGTVRRKLYFNPAYFEPQLLLAPPPAALEFLAKIREVITIAKQKMATKRFAPSLMGIPEEDTNYAIDPLYEPFHASVSRRSSIISLKRENSRRKNTCSGCPGCQPRDTTQIFTDISSLVVCEGCTSTSENKQRSIRKWLEDIPVLKYAEDVPKAEEAVCKNQRRLRSPARSLPPEETASVRALSPRPASERGKSPLTVVQRQKRRKRQKICKPKAPPPPRPDEFVKEHHYDSVPNSSHPDMITEAIAAEKEEIRIPTLTKKQMKAVIEEFSMQKGLRNADQTKVEYEADSLERNAMNRGCGTPSEYADMSSSQHSPSLSTALPLEEELTIRNAVLKKEETEVEEEHDYELIVLRKGQMKNRGLNHRNHDYNLVSEVYVNNGYNYSSNPSTDSNSSTLEKPLKVRYDGGAEKPGKLLIEVEDCLDNYIPVNDSDEFEPDTLDRKPSKTNKANDEETDQPRQILLRSNGSFKKESNNNQFLLSNPNNFNRAFGSLREIYEAKTRAMKRMESVEALFQDEGKLLTLEKKHTKRQRGTVPPDLIPPPPHDNRQSIYEQPKPPRKVDSGVLVKPPLPPKNVIGRGANRNTAGNTQVGTPVEGEQKVWKKFVDGKHDDSGYLSNDSNDAKNRLVEVEESGKASESEGSLDEGQSESGAESVETHSVFFGTFRQATNCQPYESLDSGVFNEKYHAYDIARPLNKSSLIT